jgi:hypothetical protein
MRPGNAVAPAPEVGVVYATRDLPGSDAILFHVMWPLTRQGDTEIDCLVEKGFLKPERRHVHSAIQSAIDDFICHALGAEQDQNA